MKNHLPILDGLRGVAAIGVTIFHYLKLTNSENFLPLAWLAVDFFFLLSGFVLSLAYSEALLEKRFASIFVKLRLMRLYPMATLGTALMVVYFLTHDMMTGSVAWLNAAFNVLLLPTPFNTGRGAFAYNPPAWSLFCEILVNIAYAYMARWLSNGRLLALVFISIPICVWATALLGEGPLVERNAVSLIGVVARTTGPFFLGVLLHRFWQQRPAPSFPYAFWVLAPILLLIFAAPVPGPWLPIYFLTASLVAFPAIVYIGASSTNSSRLVTALGEISYPIYAIHYGVILMLRDLDPFLLIALICVVSWAAGRWIDAPIRRFLRARLAQSR